ncbi:methyl-accepting chemotaxis protein [Methylibium petroleiphilum]|uniref:Methyl-accepting chemotaxis protein n=1 Tax=Methylibium petroleiphilum (strain ATCC BAA-1232 / LMG 22953 / PM1) TaxID=420662 RepID=A2SDZ5_METPP|nr:methyl-accepting chemotaxis protein [Methylibium petroleiphilum]ABM93784.1 methyl-accepting chemotaxis protein [Methylibium petroleiphilum PM1]
MLNLSLRQKFHGAMIVVLMVSAIVLWGNRILGKCAQLHYFERMHLAQVSEIEKLLASIRSDEHVDDGRMRRELLQYIDLGQGYARSADAELLEAEKLVFKILGFAPIIELPRKDVFDLEEVRSTLQSSTAESGVSSATAQSLRLKMMPVSENSDRFAELLPTAVKFAKELLTASAITGLVLLGATLVFLRRGTLRPINEILTVAQTIAGGNLDAAIAVRSKDEFGELMGALNNMKNSLADLVRQVSAGSGQISKATREVASGNSNLSARTESQAAALQKTAASTVELKAAAERSAVGAERANSLAFTAASRATVGREIGSQLVEMMTHIKTSSELISNITSVIDGIASQINILSLNAAVEAARAGQQGRGFAVVAAEVRELAQRSASAAREIKQLIDESAVRVMSGSDLAHRSDAVIAEVETAIKEVAVVISEIAVEMRDQCVSVTEIAQAVGQMDIVTQQNAALVEQAAVASDSLHSQAVSLTQAISVFKVSDVTAAPA